MNEKYNFDDIPSPIKNELGKTAIEIEDKYNELGNISTFVLAKFREIEQLRLECKFIKKEWLLLKKFLNEKKLADEYQEWKKDKDL